MATRLYISHSRLESLSVEDRVRIDKSVVTLDYEGHMYRLKPAVRFMRLVSKSASDPKKLLGKVKEIAVITREGGEHYLNSVLFGEVAYDVEQGFLGEVVDRDRDRDRG